MCIFVKLAHASIASVTQRELNPVPLIRRRIHDHSAKGPATSMGAPRVARRCRINFRCFFLFVSTFRCFFLFVSTFRCFFSSFQFFVVFFFAFQFFVVIFSAFQFPICFRITLAPPRKTLGSKAEFGCTSAA